MVNNLPLSFVLSFAFVFGALIGSFLNVCIYRLPLQQSVAFPASHCMACSTPLAWYENLPLISYLLQRGHCRTCGASFSIRYFVVEFLTALLAVAVILRFGVGLDALGYFAFGAALMVITFIDLDHQIIPDVISLPGVILGILFSSIASTLSLRDSLIG